MRGYPNTAVLMVVAMMAAGCSEPLRPPPSDDWRLPLAPGTPEIAAAAVTDGATRVPLVATPQPAPEDDALGMAQSLLVDEQGYVYVLDVTAAAVKVFDREARLVRQWGGRGQEPGKLFGPSDLVWIEGHVGVVDPAALRMSVWTREGEHVADRGAPIFREVIMAATLSGDAFAATLALEEQLRRQQSLSVVSADGVEVDRVVVLPHDSADRDSLFPRSDFAIAGDRIYVTTGEAYQVHAFDVEGRQLWALRAPWPRSPVTDEAIGRSMERTRRAGRAMGENVRGDRGAEIPDYLPALADLASDGLGRLYVFPNADGVAGPGQYPVDVYDPDGVLLVHGTLPFQGWDAADGADIYRLERDVLAGTTRLTRYRLELPAD